MAVSVLPAPPPPPSHLSFSVASLWISEVEALLWADGNIMAVHGATISAFFSLFLCRMTSSYILSWIFIANKKHLILISHVCWNYGDSSTSSCSLFSFSSVPPPYCTVVTHTQQTPAHRQTYKIHIIYYLQTRKYEVCRPTKPHSQDFPPPVWRLGTVKARNEPNGATKSDAHFTRYQILRMHSA